MPWKDTPEAQTELDRIRKESKRLRGLSLQQLVVEARNGSGMARLILVRRVRKGQ